MSRPERRHRYARKQLLTELKADDDSQARVTKRGDGRRHQSRDIMTYELQTAAKKTRFCRTLSSDPIHENPNDRLVRPSQCGNEPLEFPDWVPRHYRSWPDRSPFRWLRQRARPVRGRVSSLPRIVGALHCGFATRISGMTNVRENLWPAGQRLLIPMTGRHEIFCLGPSGTLESPIRAYRSRRRHSPWSRSKAIPMSSRRFHRCAFVGPIPSSRRVSGSNL
jgi:hypothetical protein